MNKDKKDLQLKMKELKKRAVIVNPFTDVGSYFSTISKINALRGGYKNDR